MYTRLPAFLYVLHLILFFHPPAAKFLPSKRHKLYAVDFFNQLDHTKYFKNMTNGSTSGCLWHPALGQEFF